MAIQDALVVLVEQWDDVMANMRVESRAVLSGLLIALGEPGQLDVTARIAELLAQTLPGSHPVRRALTTGTLFASATLDWPALARRLRELPVTCEPRAADAAASERA